MPESTHFLYLAVGLLYLASFLTILRVLLRYRTAQAAVAWILAILMFPVVAIPAYLLLGRKKFLGYLQARRLGDRTLLRLIEKEVTLPQSAIADHESLPPVFSLLEQFSRFPATRHNKTRLLINGEQTVHAMFEAIQQARDYILVEFYIINGDTTGFQLKERLIAKARQGVRVYVLYDEIGSNGLSQGYIRALRRQGIEIHSFGSLKKYLKRMQINFRNHRKVLVVDGHTGFTGGINIGDEYLGSLPKHGHWRDTHLQITGPATLGLQMAFLEDWHWATAALPELNWQPHHCTQADETALILPSGPADEQETGELFFLAAINSARARLWIATPYFVPTYAILRALELAVLRGVDVRVLIPVKPDHKVIFLATQAFLEDTDRAGIAVFGYQKGFMHQKILLVDDALASVGSANFDTRSMQLNFEINALCAHPARIREVTRMLEKDFESAEFITADHYRDRGLTFRIACRTARLFSPIL